MRGNGQYLDLGNVTGDVTIDASRGAVQAATLTGNVTLALTNLVDGAPFILILTQDGVGARTVAWNGAGGATIVNSPTIATGTGQTSTLVFFGIDSQDAVTKTAAFVAGVNASAGGSGGLPVTSGFVTIANSAANSPEGVSVDVLAGDQFRVRAAGTAKLTVDDTNVSIAGDDGSSVLIGVGDGEVTIGGGGGTIRINGDTGFFGGAAVPKPTGVAVTAAAVHAALVTLGLIAGP